MVSVVDSSSSRAMAFGTVAIGLGLFCTGLVLAVQKVVFEDSTEYEGSPCKLAGDVSGGICRSAAQCPALRQTPRNSWRTCGFAPDSQPIVCCPELPSALLSSRYARRLSTCNGTKGVSRIDDHVEGGSMANDNEFPYIAALGYLKGGQIEFRCGASLVSDRFLLTAAHCKQSDGPVVARFGVVKLTREDAVDIAIRNLTRHPDYFRGRKEFRNDLAVIELERPVDPVEEDFLQPICLFDSLADPPPTIQLTIAGWGEDANGTQDRNYLMKATVHTIDNEACNSSGRFRHRLLDGQLCAQNLTAEGKPLADTCQGDSGGPLQLVEGRRAYLVGITSVGSKCGTYHETGVYTRVADYLDWIESMVWGD